MDNRFKENEISRLFDVCNGDADGLCSVLQWRLNRPFPATLVTGIKRDIELLQLVPVQSADEVLVCDLSMKRNRGALMNLLDAGVDVRYFDHHGAGEVPVHARLDAHLDFSSDVCTSLLVDRYLGGLFRAWALVGAYGDELNSPADRLAVAVGFDEGQRARLRRLGRAINYNAYGEEESDVCIHPCRLYQIMAQYRDPLSMLAGEPIVADMENHRNEDLNQAMNLAPLWLSDLVRVTMLPAAAWSRRVIGCLANELALAYPAQAQAVLLPRGTGELTVSVRAPRATPSGASVVCEAFGGGGRAAAAGIDTLPAQDLDRFVEVFSRASWGLATAKHELDRTGAEARGSC